MIVAFAAHAADEGLSVHGELRALETLPTPFAVDGDGAMVGWGPALDTRWRTGLEWAAPEDAWRAEAELDVFSGQLAGQTWALPSIDERGRDVRDAVSLAGVVPRRLLVGGRFPWFDVEAGLTASTWGLGMVANDGATDPLFGRTDFGDRALRLRLATAPFKEPSGPGGRLPLYLLLVGDRVVADDLARWSEGDAAWQGILAALYVRDVAADAQGRAGTRRAGLYGVAREQRSGNGDHLAARVVDTFGDWTFRPDGWSLRLGAEGAFTAGRTDAARSYLHPEGVRVRQGGATVRAALGRGPVTAHLRGHWASGDSTTDDDVVTDFRYDRDADVGMVLFDEYLSAVNLGAWRLATDPARAAQPPDGVDLLVDEGAFHAATALQPAVVLHAAPWLELRAGAVLAWSTSPIGTAYDNFVNGGVPAGPSGPTSGRWLGSELDWAVATRELPIEGWLVRPSLELQVGHAFPGAALRTTAPRVDHVLLAARARY